LIEGLNIFEAYDTSIHSSSGEQNIMATTTKLRILCKSTFGQWNCKTFWLVVVGERTNTQKNKHLEDGLRLEKEWMRSGCPSLDFASFKLGNPNLVLPNFNLFLFCFLE
jgi:hypothetical protein